VLPKIKKKYKIQVVGRWLTAVIIATQEAESRKIAGQSQPGQIVPEILCRKKPSQKRAAGVA
jgi:hypothetical protein